MKTPLHDLWPHANGMRTQRLFTIDEPVSRAMRRGAEVYSLYPDRESGRRGVFEDIGTLSYLPPGKKKEHDQPKLWFNGHTIYTVTEGGADSKQHQEKSSIFTITTKMSAPSFSLPAGPLSMHGTCAAATSARREQSICRFCYVLKWKNYNYPNVSMTQAARYYWVLQLLREGGATELARHLIVAISDYAHMATLQSMANGSSVRKTLELGVWGKDRIMFPEHLQAFGGIVQSPVYEVEFPEGYYSVDGVEIGGTRDFFRHRGVKDGDVVGFFRIHDSGDFSIGNDIELWVAYFEAWVIVAQAFPQVIFWAPTRLWYIPRMRDLMIEGSRAASNLRVRCSAVHMGDPPPPPLAEGLPNGTAVVTGPGGPETPIRDYRGELAQPCAVDLHHDAPSCMGNSCRGCWIIKKRAISYYEKPTKE